MKVRQRTDNQIKEIVSIQEGVALWLPSAKSVDDLIMSHGGVGECIGYFPDPMVAIQAFIMVHTISCMTDSIVCELGCIGPNREVTVNFWNRAKDDAVTVVFRPKPNFSYIDAKEGDIELTPDAFVKAISSLTDGEVRFFQKVPDSAHT